MKNILVALAMIFSFLGYSQSVFIPSVVHKVDSCNSSDIAVYSKFINKFTSTTLIFERIEKKLSTNKWSNAFCDCELCHDTATNSAEFIIAIGDSCSTSAHFYPNSTEGSGMVKIKIYAKGDPSNFVIGQFSASCTIASAVFIKNEKIIVSPNPANTFLTIQFGSVEPYILSLITAEGKIVLNEQVESLMNSIDISGLNKGLYAIKIESAGKVFYSKFIKI